MNEALKYTRFRDIPQFTGRGNYRVDVPWNYIRQTIDRYQKGDGCASLDC